MHGALDLLGRATLDDLTRILLRYPSLWDDAGD